MTIGMCIFIKLIICDYRAILTNCFFKISCITSVQFTGFFSISSIRIWWILKCRRIHSAVFFCSQTTLFIFNNCLFRKASDKKLIFCYFFKISFADFQEWITVCQQHLNYIFHIIISLMIEDAVIVIWICIMLQLFWNFIRIILCKIYNQFWNTGVYQLHTTQKSNVRFNHHRIHTTNTPVQFHYFCNLTTKVFYTVTI